MDRSHRERTHRRRGRLWVSLLASSLMVVGLSGVGTAAEFRFTSENGEVTITEYTGLGGDVVVPSTIDGEPVTGIGSAAFYYNDSVASIALPNTVRTIASRAFLSLGGLTNLVIPAGVETIGQPLVDRCVEFRAFTVDEANPWFASFDGVLLDKDLSAVIQCPEAKTGGFVFPETVTSMRPEAFSGCARLGSVTVSPGVLSIPERAFYDARGLTNLILPENLLSIGASAFYHCNSLTNFTIPQSLTTLATNAFAYCISLTEIAVPPGITSVADNAFENCLSVTNLIVPDSVTAIGKESFRACIGLTNVVLPGSVTVLGEGAFNNCTGLRTVSIPESIASIGKDAFLSCTGLLEIRIPNSVSFLGEKAFFNCGSLGKAVLSSNVASILPATFGWCSTLTNVVVPEGVGSIGEQTFVECRSLKTVELPASVTSISSSAFYGCRVLEAINVNPENQAYNSVEGVLFGGTGETLLNFPEGKAGSYVIPSGVREIGSWAFYDCDWLESVTIPASVMTIEPPAFDFCRNLRALYFRGTPPAVESLGGFGDAFAVYYLAGAEGWGPIYGGLPTHVWDPKIPSDDPEFGVKDGRFGFSITGAPGLTVVIEATTNLTNPTWTTISTNTLPNGSDYFSDPDGANHPIRVYRLRGH